MTFRTVITLGVVLSLVLCLNCDHRAMHQPQEEVVTEDITGEVVSIDPLIHAVEAKGFCREQIVDTGDAFVVDGDIVFPKAHLIEDLGGDLAKTTQYATTNAVSWSKSDDIALYLDESLREEPWGIDYYQMIEDAADEWNSVGSTKLDIIAIGPGQEACCGARVITIYADSVDIDSPCGDFENLSDGGNVLGKAAFPRSNGDPGEVISMNVSLGPTFFYSNMLGALVHEIGHAIGFRHTNWAAQQEGVNQGCANGANQIGLLTTDSQSVMNSGSLGGDLSTKDKKATRILYPSSLSAPNFASISFTVINENPTVASVSVTYKNEERAHRVEIWRSVGGGSWQKIIDFALPSVDDQTPRTHIFSENNTGQVSYKLRIRNYKGDYTSSYSTTRTITIPYTGGGGLPL